MTEGEKHHNDGPEERSFTSTMERLDGARAQHKARDKSVAQSVVVQVMALIGNAQACANLLPAMHQATNFLAHQLGPGNNQRACRQAIDPVKIGWGLIAVWQVNRAQFISQYQLDAVDLAMLDQGIVGLATGIGSGKFTVQSAAQGFIDRVRWSRRHISGRRFRTAGAGIPSGAEAWPLRLLLRLRQGRQRKA